jgi:hypothetical protein
METTATPAARPQRRTAAPKQGRKAPDRIKATIVMSGSVDFRLSSIAASLRMDRSQLAAKLIDEGLRRYSLDAVLRQFADRQSLDGDVSQAETAA